MTASRWRLTWHLSAQPVFSVDTRDPADFDLKPARAEDLRGGDAVANADVVRRLVNGELGPVRDAVLLNSAVAQARDPVGMAHGFRLAVEAGRAGWRSGVMARQDFAVPRNKLRFFAKDTGRRIDPVQL